MMTMTSQSPAWVGLFKIWPGRENRMCTGSDVWQDSGPDRRETSSIGASSPSVHLGQRPKIPAHCPVGHSEVYPIKL